MNTQSHMNMQEFSVWYCRQGLGCTSVPARFHGRDLINGSDQGIKCEVKISSRWMSRGPPFRGYKTVRPCSATNHHWWTSFTDNKQRQAPYQIHDTELHVQFPVLSPRQTMYPLYEVLRTHSDLCQNRSNRYDSLSIRYSSRNSNQKKKKKEKAKLCRFEQRGSVSLISRLIHIL